jgi:hypothetical protein
MSGSMPNFINVDNTLWNTREIAFISCSETRCVMALRGTSGATTCRKGDDKFDMIQKLYTIMVTKIPSDK